MERYDRYKDSGVEWIGEIPEGWVTRRLKNFLDSVPHSIVDGPFGSDLKSDEYTDTGVPVTQLNNIKEGFHRVDSFKFVSESKAAQLSSHFVFPGDLLMAKMMPAGRTCIASSAYPKYLLSSDSIRIVIDSSVDRRFVCYAANCYCLAECELKSSGVTRIRINLSIVRNLSFVLPSLQEQKKIADYLDQKTAEIDSLIEKNEKSIELLEEYRKSVISEAVTKGLDPNVPMKDSGVDWIGDIPEGWGVNKLKFLAYIQGGSTPSKDNLDYWNGDIPWVSSGEVKSSVLFDTSQHVSDLALQKCNNVLFHPGSVVMVVRSGILKHTLPVALLMRPMTINQDVKAFVFNENIDPRFFIYFVNGLNDKLLLILKKDGSTVDNLDVDLVVNCSILQPSLREQKQIIDYLDEKTFQIDSLIDKKKQLIEKLQEYRKSLISECVTGKVKVPGA